MISGLVIDDQSEQFLSQLHSLILADFNWRASSLEVSLRGDVSVQHCLLDPERTTRRRHWYSCTTLSQLDAERRK